MAFLLGSYVEIKFLKWEKYNKRQKDIVRPFWYAMSNRFFYDPDFMHYSNEEKLTLFFLLGEASQQNKYGEVSVNEEFYSRITGFNKQILFSTVDKLLKSGAAAGWRQDGGRNATATEQNKTEQNKTEGREQAPSPPLFFLKVWNENRGSLAEAKALSSKRKQSCNSRFKENNSEEYWIDVVKKLAASKFCCGENDRGWKADFDFFIKPDTHTKVMEGKYQSSSFKNKNLRPSTERQENLDEEFFGSKK